MNHPITITTPEMEITLRPLGVREIAALPAEAFAAFDTTENHISAPAADWSNAPLKILADGTQVPATDPRTDHVAVQFPDGVLVCAYSLGRDNNTKPYSTHQDAEAGAAALDLLGRKWELAMPLDALKYVIDYNRHEPAFDRNLFPGLKTNDWSWLATHCAWSKDAAGVASRAWSAGLNLGHVYNAPRNGSGFGLAVSRPGQ